MAVRSLTLARSASEIPMSALNFLESGNGSDGWLSTGASTMSSTIMASAKPPVKHMPTTPTPGPPQRSCSEAASLRSHTVIGLVLLSAKAENSRETHAGPMDCSAYPADAGRPGSPKSTGRTAVQPAAATLSAELGDQRRDARDLADDDDGGTGPDPEHVAPFALGLEGFLGEIPQFRLPPARFAVGHGGTVASAVVAGPMRSFDPRLPVLVGLGAAASSASVADLMTDAVVAAAADAGAPGLLGGIDCIAVPQGSWSLTDPARTVARRVGSPDARTLLCEIGVSQQEVINYGLAAVAAGQAETFVVAGAEARAFDRAGGIDTDEEDQPPDQVLTRPPDFVAPVEIAAGMVWPVAQQYALIENALAAAEHLAPDRQRAEIAALWARYNAVAAHNPEAAFPQPLDASDIADARPAQPAARLSVQPVARQPVDRRSGLGARDLLGRAGACGGRPARPLALPPRRVAFVGGRHPDRRDDGWRRGRPWACSAGPRPRHIGRPLRELPLAEVYSCFPAAVQVQQRELELDRAGTPTLNGGMAFAGGPFNHFVLQSLRGLGGPPARRTRRRRAS